VLTFGGFVVVAVLVQLLLRIARSRQGEPVGLGRISPAIGVRDGLSRGLRRRQGGAASYRPEPAQLTAPGPEGLPDDVLRVRIIAPTAAQAHAGLRRLRHCVMHWRGKPGLFVEGEHLALIVRLREVMQDAGSFRLRLTVDEVIGAPAGFDSAAGIERLCGWNQPFMVFDEDGVSAPYAFYLHFGGAGVANVREFWAPMRAAKEVYTARWRGVLRGCFIPGVWQSAGAVERGSSPAAASGSSRSNGGDPS
jgi:hypothetical protein